MVMTQASHNSISTLVISKFDDMREVFFQHMDSINARLAEFEDKLDKIERLVKTKKDIQEGILDDEEEVDNDEDGEN